MVFFDVVKRGSSICTILKDFHIAWSGVEKMTILISSNNGTP